MALICAMIVSVDVLPVFSIVSSAARLPFAAHDVGLRRITVAHLRDVAYINHAAFDVLIGRLLSAATLSVLPFICTLYSRAPILAVPPGRIRFCALTALTTSLGDKPFGLQRTRIDVDHDLADLAAKGQRDGRTLHCSKLCTDEAVAEVVERLLGQRIARQPELQYRDSRRVIRNDVRRQGARRQHAQEGFGSSSRLPRWRD